MISCIASHMFCKLYWNYIELLRFLPSEILFNVWLQSLIFYIMCKPHNFICFFEMQTFCTIKGENLQCNCWISASDATMHRFIYSYWLHTYVCVVILSMLIIVCLSDILTNQSSMLLFAWIRYWSHYLCIFKYANKH